MEHNKQDIMPASLYLQEKLLESRAKKPSLDRGRQSDFGPQTMARDDDLFLDEGNKSSRLYDSSPLAPFAAYNPSRKTSHASSNSSSARGARATDAQIDRLTKANFDLKLELDHRRGEQAKLQAQIERMRETVERAEILREEHAELLRINSALVEELEKRDEAIREAADLICDLEGKVESTRPGTARQTDSGYAGTEIIESSPQRVPKLLAPVDLQPSGKLRREPSFVSQQQASTHNLRQAFRAVTHDLRPVQSFMSILSKQTATQDDEEAVLNSPRLSALSESSFPSLYSPRKDHSPDRHACEPAPTPTLFKNEDSNSRVRSWIEVVDDTPSKSQHLQRSAGQANFHELPLDPALAAGERAHSRRHRAVADDANLPPTPDSFSTSMLRNSRSSIVDDRSFTDPKSLSSRPERLSISRTAPKQMRSSVELHGAFHSNLQFRNASEQSHDGNDDDEPDTEYDGYPDGNSILNGTPSRFTPRARRPSEEPTQHKPLIRRADTSPQIPMPRPTDSATSFSSSDGGRTAIVETRPGPTSRSTSPTLSPTLSPQSDRPPSRFSPFRRPSITRSVSQKANRFFRRLSASAGSDYSAGRDKDKRERELSPQPALPTLTSTPSSAYVNHASQSSRPPPSATRQSPPREGTALGSHPTPRSQPPPLSQAQPPKSPRRPSSSSHQKSSSATPRPKLASSGRTKTSPAASPSSVTTCTGPASAEKKTGGPRNIFKRGGSFKRTEGAVEEKGKDGRRAWR